MIKNKKNLFLFSALFFFIISFKCNALVVGKIIATVGDKPVTSVDLINEIKLLNIINKGALSNQEPKILQRIGLRSLVDRMIKQIEIDKFNANRFSQAVVEEEIQIICKNLEIDKNQLKKVFQNNNVPFAYLEKRIASELKWNSFIYQYYKNRIKINDNEIIEKLNKIKKRKFFNEYLLSEIVLEKISGEDFNSEIKKIKDSIKVNGFNQTAIAMSTSGTAQNGGNLGWINEKQLYGEVKKEISKTKVGSVTKAVSLPEGVIIFKINDKREIKIKIDLEKEKQNLVNVQKNKQFNTYSSLHFQNIKNSTLVKYN
ncbi:MAG: hypothetical protein CBC24_01325 [Candidatus Pelagibacter sp. TMED64]|nr:hypothetical protein [Candidatus Pelagibacter sp.]OUU67323.1 MAG: hypothetical protein CBC24_01325 [Candidatus Pelagibacter sp. TMED64]|tara:strand:- start:590 stop:1531 length:942 start_codon:yes stop_codon:yes gene_type:complete